MGLDKPQDFAWLFIIFAAVIFTVGSFIVDMNETDNLGADNSFFINIENKINSTTGLKGASDDQRPGLIGESGASNEPTEDNIIVSTWNSLRKLGKLWALIEQSMQDVFDQLGINPLLLILITAGLLITFAVIIFRAIRSGG